MSKLLFFDLETTGIKHWENGIHQISGIVDIDGEVKESFNFYVRPHDGVKIELSALNVSGVTYEEIMQYESSLMVKSTIDAILNKYVDKYNKNDKFHLVGYNNAHFDNSFLRAFWQSCGDNYFGSMFWSDSIDVMVLASNKLKEKRHTMMNFKLATVASELGIYFDEKKLHDAMYDIKITRRIYYMLNP